MAQTKLDRIVWAVDLTTDKKTILSTANVLESIRAGRQIQPVSVLSPEQMNLYVKMTKSLASHYMDSAQKSLDRLFESVTLEGLAAPKVILQPEPSHRKTVDEVWKYAQRVGAGLIVTNTHARTGIQRFFMGSFSETLAMRARVPLLILNPKVKAAPKLNHLFFPTDFSKASQKAFGKAMDFANGLGAKITIYHHLRWDDVGFRVPYWDGEASTYEVLYKDAKKNSKTTGAKWVSLAKKRGIRCTFVLGTSQKPIPDAILLEASKRKANLLGIASESGTIETALFGSIARRVIRGAKQPVWIIHSK